MTGADVAQLRELAHYLTQAEAQLTQLRGRIDARVGTPAWQGSDAQRFRSQWQSQHRSTIVSAAAALAGMAKRVAQDAAEQEQASSAGGSAGTFHRSRHLAPSDYLELAKSSRDSSLPPGWHRVTDGELRKLGIDPKELNTRHGMNASIVQDSDGRYVLIFEGSSHDDGDVDWRRENARSAGQSGALGGIAGQGVADVAEILDPGSSTEEAMKLAVKLKSAVGADHMSLTGWSLGGRHAAAASIVTGADAVTFDAAGVTNNDRLFARSLLGEDTSLGEYFMGRMGVEVSADESHITNYRASADPLTLLQTMTPASDAAGRQVNVAGAGHGLDQFDGKI